MTDVDGYCVFAYRYRDAANYKATGEVLLSGPYSPFKEDVIRQQCDMCTYFVAEQVRLPALYSGLYRFSDGPTDDDVAFHEFVGLRPATPNEVTATRLWGTLDELANCFRDVKLWDCRLSPHC